MAHMYPDTLEGVDVQSPAERRLFAAFQQELSDHFTVLHSVAWLGVRAPGAAPVDGEADFVIIHPQMGILVIEVKGGVVGYDASSGWHSRRHDGSTIAIKDPFTQARRSKYALLHKVESLPNWPGRTPTIGHAVAFPDGTIDLPDLGPEAPPEIVLLHHNLVDVEAWLRGCLKYWAGESFVAPGQDGATALLRLLRRTWEMREPRIGEQIGPEETSIHRYTIEQFRILDLLSRRPRAAICGCAGSGKTILAIEKARRLAAEGFQTLLTCYNRNLADHLRRSIPSSPRLKVEGFHALCQEFASRSGRDRRPDWDPSRENFYEEVMPDALAEASAMLGEEARFDAIVVDEGQDFDESWWVALQMLQRDPAEGIFYVFYDDNQQVYGRAPNLPVEDLPYTLTVNCRNTRRIHEAFAGFYRSGGAITSAGPEGRPLDLRAFNNGDASLRAVLTEVLTQLVYVEDVPPKDIVVLSPGGLEKPPLKGMEPPGAFRLSALASSSSHELWATTIRQFKGLESPVVVLIVPEDIRPRDELLYVGLSRARNHAVIVADEAVGNDLRAAIHLDAVN
jgi:hypothetical protein